MKNIFRMGAKRNAETGKQNSTLGTLADFLEVDGAYEQVVDEFLRDELNYVVVKDWEAANEGIKLLKSEVAGRATFLVGSGGGIYRGTHERDSSKCRRRTPADRVYSRAERLRALVGGAAAEAA